MKSKIRDEFRQTEFEAKSLADYKAELEQLVQEKMAHVEELRLIHADINMMESIIKQVSPLFMGFSIEIVQGISWDWQNFAHRLK